MEKLIKLLNTNNVPYEIIDYKYYKAINVYNYSVDNMSPFAKRLSTVCVITIEDDMFYVGHNYNFENDRFNSISIYPKKAFKKLYNDIIKYNYIVDKEIQKINEYGLKKINIIRK